MKTYFFKYAPVLFLAIYFMLGVFFAPQVGVTWDEDAEHKTVLTNIAAVDSLYRGDLAGFHSLNTYVDRYNGIGFQILAYPLARLIAPLLSQYAHFNTDAADLLALHSCIFICFFLCGIFVKKILQLILQDELVSNLGMFVFLLWPYVLGHGMMNPKDTPFMLAWLICSYYLVLLFQAQSRPSIQNAIGTSKNWIFLGIAVGWMVALRINGLLLFIVYFFCFWVCARLREGVPKDFKSGTILMIWVSILTLFLFTPIFWDASLNTYRGIQFLLTRIWNIPPTTPGDFLIPEFGFTYRHAQFSFSPLFWGFPLDFIRALKHFQSVLYQGDTLTAGQFLSALNLPITYIPLWLAVKLPLMILLGLLLLPYSLWCVRRNKEILASLPLGFIAITLGIFVIILALVLRHARLHDELRHILFIFPMLWIVGICSLYYCYRKFIIATLILTGTLFVWDISKIHPYEYVWFNEPARFLGLEEQYENDYWGTSVGPMYQWLDKNAPNAYQDCIYLYPQQLRHYFDTKKFKCLEWFSDSNLTALPISTNERPYWIMKITRFRNLEIPPSCTLMHQEKIQLPLSRNEIDLAQIYYCK
jgi:hypothetical protein